MRINDRGLPPLLEGGEDENKSPNSRAIVVRGRKVAARGLVEDESD